MMKQLVQYIRDERGHRVGVMVAEEHDGEVLIGVSKCNMKKDKFNRDIGIRIAQGRIVKGSDCHIPASFRPQVDIFVDKAKYHFSVN